MAPDVDELIKRVNTLTLDKNRLKQKLTQLTNDQNGNDALARFNQSLSLKAHQTNPDSIESSFESNSQSLNSISNILNSVSNHSQQSPSNHQNSSNTSRTGSTPPRNKPTDNLIAGVECATSCEDDILYINELLRKRIDEYNDNWDYIQSKCSALLSELNALQVHYGQLKNEQMDLDEKYKKKCEECDDVKSELQTVVLNYETQLSAMSEHLSAMTSRQIS